jgi:DNA-binding CsgD family transcriptional regulator
MPPESTAARAAQRRGSGDRAAALLASQLTPRELDVLCLLAGGERSDSVAQLLLPRPHTVRTHSRTSSPNSRCIPGGKQSPSPSTTEWWPTGWPPTSPAKRTSEPGRPPHAFAVPTAAPVRRSYAGNHLDKGPPRRRGGRPAIGTLAGALAERRFQAGSDPELLRSARCLIVLAPGAGSTSPSRRSLIRRLESIRPGLADGQLLALEGSHSPEAERDLAGLAGSLGLDVDVAFCRPGLGPEGWAASDGAGAIVAGSTPESYRRAERAWRTIAQTAPRAILEPGLRAASASPGGW